MRIGATKCLRYRYNLIPKTIAYVLREIAVIPHRISRGFEIRCHIPFRKVEMVITSFTPII